MAEGSAVVARMSTTPWIEPRAFGSPCVLHVPCVPHFGHPGEKQSTSGTDGGHYLPFLAPSCEGQGPQGVLLQKCGIFCQLSHHPGHTDASNVRGVCTTPHTRGQSKANLRHTTSFFSGEESTIPHHIRVHSRRPDTGGAPTQRPQPLRPPRPNPNAKNQEMRLMAM